MRILGLMLPLAFLLCACGSEPPPPTPAPPANKAPIREPAPTPEPEEPKDTAFRILDLSTGEIKGFDTVPRVGVNVNAKTAQIVFARIEGGGFMRGERPASPVRDGIEASYVEVAPFYIAVFETTIGQWEAIADTNPWTRVSPKELFGVSTFFSTLPAYGMSFKDVKTALSTHLGAKLALPTDDQWEFACLAGGEGMFAWGDEMDHKTIAPHARVRETIGFAAGPGEAGKRRPNEWGLFDMHGNLWEWTASGRLRGGSWSDNVFQARAANAVKLDEDTPHGLAGVRFVLKD